MIRRPPRSTRTDTLFPYPTLFRSNDFNRFGRTYQVNVQADQKFRLAPEQIGQLKVRNNRGEMVPLSTFVNVTDSAGPDRVRSEEHTSELQSLMRISYAVFCLKKKNNKIQSPIL